jgi:hypothetical protein
VKSRKKLISNKALFLSIKILSLVSILLILIYLIVATDRSPEDSAASATIVEFKIDSIQNLNTSQKITYESFNKSTSFKKATVLSVSDYNKIITASDLIIPLGGNTVTLKRKSLKNTYKDVQVWSSDLNYRRTKYTSHFAVNNNTLVAIIDTGNRKFEMVSVGNNKVVLGEVSPEKLSRHPRNWVPQKSRLTNSLETPRPSSKTSTNSIDILAVYTPEFERSFGTVSNAQWQMASMMAIQVESINQILNNTLIPGPRVKLVGDMKFAIDTSFAQFLDNVGSDTKYQPIYQERYNKGADVVAIFHYTDGDSCGRVKALNATFSTAYMAVNRAMGCLTVNTFAHEFGHLAGGGHETHENGTVPYAHALVNSPAKFFTVMSAFIIYEPDDVEIPFFTNPNLIYVPANSYMGDTDYYNNGKRISERVQLMKNFSGSAPPQVTTPPQGTSTPQAGTGTCGSSCNTVTDCVPNEGYQCIDISAATLGNECWKDSCIISAPRNRRISGIVFDCNGSPKSGVAVSTFGASFNRNTVTNSTGKFYITEGANKCSVELDAGQTFYVVAGKDANSTQPDYYGRVTSPTFSNNAINCSNINCNYKANQATGGPSRENYHLSVDTFKSNPNVYNTFVCEESPNYLSGFDFKQVNCTNTAPSVQQEYIHQYLVRGNRLWYRDNKSGWSSWIDQTGNVSTVGSGSITSFSNLHRTNGVITQHLVRGGRIWNRTNQNGWSSWNDITSGVNSVGSGTIQSFSVNTHTSGYLLQTLVRGGKVWTRNNQNGWSSWIDSTNNFSSVGSGTITGFSANKHPNKYIVQYLTRGGKVWTRNNQNGWSNWTDVTSNITHVGSGTFQTFYISTRQ